MPRPSIDLSPYRNEITEMYNSKQTIISILTHLQNTYSTNVSRTVLYRSLSEWGLRNQDKSVTSEQLYIRIKELFFDECLNDDVILKRLQSENYIITKTRIKQIRKEQGLYRRLPTESIPAAKEQARDFFQTQLQTSTTVKDYGRNLLHTYMKQQHHIISRDDLYSIYREFAGDIIQERWGKAKYSRRDFLVPGPNWVWSVDGFDKLKQWGFEIYAGIDAYSRYITWFYCGLSSSTSWNIAVQYMDVLVQRGIMPRVIRSDHGGETAIFAGLHYYLSQHRTKEIGNDQRPISFRDCWYYGKSTHNTRIESWWRRLGQSRGGFWRVSD